MCGGSLSPGMIRGRAGLADFSEVERFQFGLAASAILRVSNDVYEYRARLSHSDCFINPVLCSESREQGNPRVLG